MNKIYHAYQQVKLDDQSQQDILNHLLNTEPRRPTMKKYIPVLILCSCLLLAFPLFSYHQSSQPSKETAQPTEKNNSHQVSTLQDAIDQGIYVDNNGTIYNQEALDQFLNAVENKQKASLVIWNITREGNPIIKTIDYTDENVQIIYDKTQDTYGDRDVKTYQYRYLGIYNDDLCAYNNELTLEAFDNDEALFITTVHHSQSQQKTNDHETFSNETFDSFPNVSNIISYLSISPSDVTLLNQTNNELIFCFYLDPQDGLYDESLYQYVQFLEKQGYQVSQYDATISSTFELVKDNYTITMTSISNDESMYNDWKELQTEDYVSKMTHEDIVYHISYTE